MNVKEAILERRAYRSLDPVEITEALIRDLAESAGLAPSCGNNQPWRFVFVHEPEALRRVQETLTKGNRWAFDASMIVVAFSRRDLDCVDGEREYYLFDTGMATAFMILRATELGLVAHPIAGYDEERVKEALGIPREMRAITLVIFGKHSQTLSPALSERQRESELRRPKRLPFEKFSFLNRYEETE